jgi:predicted kinase
MEVVILIGLPASGKTTFYRRQFAATHDHVSRDLMRSAARPQAREQQLIAASLAAGRPVVVDNTNASRAGRAAIVGLARQHGAPVIAYYFETAASDALRRNRRREGRDRVPDVAIFAVRKRLEPPDAAEGFERIYLVRLLETESRFEVTPFSGEPTNPRTDEPTNPRTDEPTNPRTDEPTNH